MEKSTKVGLICSSWALIGGFISLEFLPRFVQWNEIISFLIGLFVGGLGSYISYEFSQVKIACADTWKAMKPDFSVMRLPKKKEINMSVYIGMTLCGAVFSFAHYFIILLCLTVSEDVTINFLLVFPFLAGILAGFVFFFGVLNDFLRGNEKGLISEEEAKMFFGFVLTKVNPFALYFYWILWRGIIRFVILEFLTKKVVISGGSWCGRFVRGVFQQIHSDERVLCAVYTGIGITIGFFCGSALVGGFCAFVFGKYVGVKWIRTKILGLNGQPA